MEIKNKLNEVQIQQYLTNVGNCLRETHWRAGQACFNVLLDMFPVTAEEVRGTAIDPYYFNARLTNFFDAICTEEAKQYLPKDLPKKILSN